MKNWRYFLLTCFFSTSQLLALDGSGDQQAACPWSVDLGVQYNWMSLTTPPTCSGSVFGAQVKVTHQAPNATFAQLRLNYNEGSLHSSLTSAKDFEWSAEAVGGHSFSVCPEWTLTPYVGLGFDSLADKRKAYGSVSSIYLSYGTYYALVGLDARYQFEKEWSVGAQVDVAPILKQDLSIHGLAGTSWKMKKKVGFAARIPLRYELSEAVSLELAPYYRLLPIGASDQLGLPSRDASQYGATFAVSFGI
jgi:hypothetical protein